MLVSADQQTEQPKDVRGTCVRVTVGTPEVAAWLRRALRDYDVACEGLELEITAPDASFEQGILPILRTIEESLGRAHVAPITVAFEDRSYTMQPSAA
jgi:hypothetical protein